MNNFLTNANEKQLSEFINFIGKSVVSKEKSVVLKDEKSPWKINRIKDFWKFMLVNKPKSSSLIEFGSWTEASNEIFEVKWLASMIARTLNATDGELTWDYGLTNSIEKLAAEAPQDCLVILEKHFLWLIDNHNYFSPIRDDKEWYGAFRILYNSKDKEIADTTYNLINTLIEKGGKPFWSLEEIVK